MTLNFLLLDPDTNQTIKFVTYLMNITREDETTPTLILSELFQSPIGNLTMVLRPLGPDGNYTKQELLIHGNQDPFFNAWVADPGALITIDSVQLKSNSRYHAHLELLTVDYPRCTFDRTHSPKFDVFWSLGSDEEGTSQQSTTYIYVPEFTSTQIIFAIAVLLGSVITPLAPLFRNRLPT